MTIPVYDSTILRYIIFFILPFGFTFVANKILIRFIRTLGLRQNGKGDIRWAADPKPAIGGITFYMVFLLAATGFFFLEPAGAGRAQDTFTGLIAASTLAFLMGLADDAYGTKPLVKFLTQLLCGIILFFTGTQIRFFGLYEADFAITVLWVIGIMNSINMIDNMDGVAATISFFILSIFILVIISQGSTDNIHLTSYLSVAASSLAFLRFNWNPSKIFMGDNGSQFLGLILAYGGIRYLWNFNDPGEYRIIMPVLLVALSFCIPLSDTLIVIINRINRGFSPFIGGKDHTTHHLTMMGFTDKQVACLFVLTGIISFSMAAWLVFHGSHSAYVIYGLFIYPVSVFTVLFIVTKKKIKT